MSLENGLVLNFDARTLPTDLKSPSPARFTISAHDGAASALDVSSQLRGCICTGGADKVVKVWNIDQGEGGKSSVSMVASRDMDVVSLSFICRWFTMVDTIDLTGKSLFSSFLSRRSPHDRSCRFKSETPDLGCGCEHGRKKGICIKIRRGRKGSKRKRRQWSHWSRQRR